MFLRTRLVSALGLGLCVAAAAWGQPSGPLSQPLRDHLRNEQYAIVTSIRGLPLGVREQMQTMFGTASLDIADPAGNAQASATAIGQPPATRRLIAAGCSRDFHCLVYYERGGGARGWHVMLFQWTPAATRFEFGGAAPSGYTTIDDVRKAVLAGAVKPTSGPW